jgi:IclR family transcriptional regulator, acetate operon repressor
MADSHPASGVAVLDKALDLLECLADGHPRSIARLAAATDLNKASIYRLVATLERRGYLSRRGDRQGYTAGPSLLALSRLFVANTGLLTVAGPILRRLHEESGETVNLAVPDRDQVRYLDIVESAHGLRMSADVGATSPMYSTSLGKAILAAMEPEPARAALARQDRRKLTPHTLDDLADLTEEVRAARERGWALDDEETEVGARCVGVAVLDGAGRPIAGLSVSGPAWRLPDDTLPRVGRTLIEAARELEREAGHRPVPA